MSAQNQHCQSVQLNPLTLPAAPSPQHIAPSNTSNTPRQKVRGSQRRSKAQRVNEICQFMRKKNITLREFIHVYATTQGSSGYGERPATRAKRLAEAVYGQPEVLDALREHPASGAAGIITVKALRKEMKELEGAGGMFSAYQVDRVQEETSPAGVGREKQSEGQKVKDYERMLGDMQFGQMYEQVNTRAPLLCGLLKGLMAPKTERKDRPPRDPAKFNHRIAIITSILCYSRASEGSNKFPHLFGVFLHSNGVKQCILDLLHQFGVCEGYKGVHRHLETVAEQAEASLPPLSIDVD
ncbi:hypothetical protein P152DRAFT_454052 [Eremomyces bilateralis CBS 781.70]|uniref:Uncharacterized protein n=1 Tax=Eremomyces bilateralis CBS 781.70 TaxID=1392243 RepID=A0A6G1GHH5_9PEZI|nr:uncharacterized protein P152DRAFT_454052 [Eremomyces bilateralis CBS 781.70]KAF1817464.1 hypothetical protein P152DRAFT_454052 [Eremomyces bilateralis CBS 781.70]